MKVTRARDGMGEYGPLWRVSIGGKPTPFVITKGRPPRYAERQTWHVDDTQDDAHLFDTKSMDEAMAIISAIVAAVPGVG